VGELLSTTTQECQRKTWKIKKTGHKRRIKRHFESIKHTIKPHSNHIPWKENKGGEHKHEREKERV